MRNINEMAPRRLLRPKDARVRLVAHVSNGFKSRRGFLCTVSPP